MHEIAASMPHATRVEGPKGNPIDLGGLAGHARHRRFSVLSKRIGVVGAGIAGLATAVGLQRRSHDVTVVEQRRDTSSGAGISIWPNALAALDQLGLGDAVREAGGRITAGAARWYDGSWLRRPAAERMVTALGEPLVVVQPSWPSSSTGRRTCPPPSPGSPPSAGHE